MPNCELQCLINRLKNNELVSTIEQYYALVLYIAK